MDGDLFESPNASDVRTPESRKTESGATLCLARNAHLPGLDVSRPWAWNFYMEFLYGTCGKNMRNIWEYMIYIF